jgi:hypothetical protein
MPASASAGATHIGQTLAAGKGLLAEKLALRSTACQLFFIIINDAATACDAAISTCGKLLLTRHFSTVR